MRYAEDNLGVHTVYNEVVTRRNELDEVLSLLSETRDKKRALALSLEDKEMAVAADEWAKHPDMAVTRMEKHIKVAFSNDGEIREMREGLAKLSGEIEGLEFDRDMCETDIRIACARLQELGGYLQYLAVIKTEAGKASEANTNGDPWK
jgi:hypothetical protein